MANANDNLPRFLSASQDARVAAVVKAAEHPTPPRTPTPTGNPAPTTTLWAMLTSESTGQYKWRHQNYISGTWTDSGTETTEYTAKEVNATKGLSGQRVLLTFSGYDGTGAPIYLFTNGTGTPPTRIYVQVTGATLIAGAQARWAYSFAEVTGQWTTTGVPQLLTGGLTGTMHNTLEGNNPASGIGLMMSGPTVSSDDFANGIKLQPIPTGAVFELLTDTTCNAGSGSGSGTGSGSGSGPNTIYLFTGSNIKAECPDGGGT